MHPVVRLTEIQRHMNSSSGLASEEGDKMIVRDDENKRQVDGSGDACGGKRYCGPAVSSVSNGKDLSAVDMVGLAEDV